jgi:integrase/recombinase XerC
MFDLVKHANKTGQDAEKLRERWERLVDDFLRGRSEHTDRSYRDSLMRFSRFLKCGEDMDAMTTMLIGDGMGNANDLVLGWKKSMLDARLSPATINLRLTAVRSLVRAARSIGIVEWTLEIRGERSQPYRDTSGPTRESVKKLMALVAEHPRNLAMLRLLFDLGLRRKEVVGLDVEHVDIEKQGLWILGKGKKERELAYPSPRAWAALVAWLAVRGSKPGAVFTSASRRRAGERIRNDSVTKLVGQFGKAIKKHVTPHGLRHSATTALLDEVDGNTRIAQSFGRWAKRETAERYDDNRRKPTRDLSEKVSDWLEKEDPIV